MLNRFFNQTGQERPTKEGELIHGFVRESIQISGFDVYYIQRQLVNVDSLFGEDVQSYFQQAHRVEMQLMNVEWWDGDADLLSPMGNIFRNQVTLAVAQRRFQDVTKLAIPMEGDLIYFPNVFNKGIFEIRWVDKERQFYPLGVKPTFKLRAQLFDLSSEQFKTGIPEVDPRLNTLGTPQTIANLETLLNSDNATIQTDSNAEVDHSEPNPWGNF